LLSADNFPSFKKKFIPPIFRPLDSAAHGGRATRSLPATFLIEAKYELLKLIILKEIVRDIETGLTLLYRV